VELAKAVYGAWQLQDWDRLRELFHPDARLQTQASGEELLPGEATLRLLIDATQQTLYRAVVFDFVKLDEQAALLKGRVRYRHPAGGFADSPRCWIYVFRDGLLYRSRIFPGERVARDVFEQTGHELGVRTS
jgi:hypothetical protein